MRTATLTLLSYGPRNRTPMRIIIRVIDLRGVRVGGRRSPRDASVVVTEVVGLDAGHLVVDEVMYGSAWEVKVEERGGVNDTGDVD